MAIGSADGLLGGPRLDGRPESWAEHRARLGPLPSIGSAELIHALDASGLLGRGGAGFPVGRKWRAMAERRSGGAVVLANGAEGEPLSAKDRMLMAHRPHLVLDGAQLAAQAVGADEVVVYVGSEHGQAVAALDKAVAERARSWPPTRLVRAPIGYVAGEASAAVHFVNAADVRPTTAPPRVSERGIAGRPTLVQNVESLAWTALIARFGADWYLGRGRASTPGRALVTVTGGPRDQVTEIELGTTVRELVIEAGGDPERLGAIVLGGYFGTWVSARGALDLALDPAELRALGLTFGCGLVGLLPDDECGLVATGRILGFLAAESAGQCGQCVWGLRAIAETAAAL
ncbi:MAG TPA: hypothetical protein VET90_03915, partial [Candidatus Binatus sp.]|nr:hypothetical protein [Candidatus Binatus sp.]